MAKQKYKQKPLFWQCIQYDGTNAAELVAFCGQCAYVDGKLLFNDIPVSPTNWILQDNAGVFTMMIDSQFVAFFQLEGPAAKPGPEAE